MDYIIGNECTGLEDIYFYTQLKHTRYTLTGYSIRQLREMIVFIGQLSFLKIYNKRIYLDVLSEEDANILLNELIQPYQTTPLKDKVEEFLSITSIKNIIITPQTIKTSDTVIFSNSNDLEFAEGKRKRVHHLRIERSPLLRKIYIQLNPEPICDACKQNMKFKYPWTSYMLDLHHLLPLSSVIRTLETGTSLNDMVGLCPSCHRAIHSYYNKWLKSNNRDDFKSKVEAMDVYLSAIKEIV